MPSHSDAVETIRRFRRASEVATALEAFKYAARYGRRSRRLIALCASRCCEEELDEAWDAVGRISEGFGDFEAGLVAAHYLFCEPWDEVAGEANISIYQAKWRAYEALGWLERSLDAEAQIHAR